MGRLVGSMNSVRGSIELQSKKLQSKSVLVAFHPATQLESIIVE
jgi:hypothetical protein